MSTSSNQGESNHKSTDRSAVVLMLMDIADTTWRMFIPTLSLSIVGMLLDDTYNTGPWLAATGALSGAVVAGLLIKKQFSKLKNIDE